MDKIIKTLPDHSAELEQAENLLTKIVNDIQWHKNVEKEIPPTKLNLMVYTTDYVIGAVGDMSLSVFDIRDSLEEEYFKQYKKNPLLGKTLFLEEYEKLHKPYDRLKNKCFELLFKLDPKGLIVDEIANRN